MLMSLDQFVFGTSTLAHSELQRRTSWRHASNNRVGARPVKQFAGQGDDHFTLSGVLVPDLVGAADSLTKLRAMADKGMAYVLVDGAGTVFGAYVIADITENGSYLRADGTPQRIEFTISLERQDDERVASLAQNRGRA